MVERHGGFSGDIERVRGSEPADKDHCIVCGKGLEGCSTTLQIGWRFYGPVCCSPSDCGGRLRERIKAGF